MKLFPKIHSTFLGFFQGAIEFCVRNGSSLWWYLQVGQVVASIKITQDAKANRILSCNLFGPRHVGGEGVYVPVTKEKNS